MPAAYGRRRAALVAVAGLALLGLTAPDAAATARTSGAATSGAATVTATGTDAGFTPAQLRMQRMLSTRVRNPIFGSNVSGFVVDHASGSAVWGRYSATGMVPASTTKVLTAVAALRVLGPDSRVTTRVRRGGRTTTTQVVYLVGAGDQALSSAGLDQLAATTVKALGPLGGRRVTVAVDDSLFPAPRLSPGWSSSYYPHNVAPVRALIRDQREVYDTAIDAGAYLRARLSARGVPVGSVVRAKAPAGAPVLAARQSPPVRTMVATMLRRSDNDYAEGLLRSPRCGWAMPARGRTARRSCAGCCPGWVCR
jgi:D-alanyl-D-alanine carboxypeptidase/D-alanyl-D-alanine-endopeptidase (penicillin-binding protein 4)